VWQIPDAVDTVICAPDDGWKYHPKHVEQFPDINKLCNVASCWIYMYIGIYLTMHGPINVKSPNNTSKRQMGFNSAFKGFKPYYVARDVPVMHLLLYIPFGMDLFGIWNNGKKCFSMYFSF
jgi:hypothetical protein